MALPPIRSGQRAGLRGTRTAYVYADEESEDSDGSEYGV